MRVELNPFKKKAIRDVMKRTMEPEYLGKEVAKDFGTRVGMTVRDGLDVETSFQFTKDFFIAYGKAMQDFGEKIELHMMPPGWPEKIK